MTIEEFEEIFRDKYKFHYNGRDIHLKLHLMYIIRDELRKFYLQNYPNKWIETRDLPKDLRKLFKYVVVSGDYDFIHKFKSMGVINTGWDYTECFKLIDNQDIVINYQKHHGNFDPPGRSLINFLETHEQALWQVIEHFQKMGCSFSKNRKEFLKQFCFLLKRYSNIIFDQMGDLFPNMIKEIIITNSLGRKAVENVTNDLRNKGYKFILTEDGDLLDIEKGIDLIFISPFGVSYKTMQIKTLKEISWGKKNDNIIVYCSIRALKSYEEELVDYFAFSKNDDTFYFFNDDVKKKKDNNGYVFKPDTFTLDLINYNKKPVLTI